MIDCCELALYNSQLVFRVVMGAFGVIAFLLAMFFGYNLKWRKQQIELSKRTEQLEKKNGKEEAQLLKQLKEIEELKTKVEKLERQKKSNS